MAPSHDLTAAPHTDPTAVYFSRDALYADDMLIAALVHLDFFSWLAGCGDAGASLLDICSSLGLAERPADVMVTLFKARGLLREIEDGTLHLMPAAAE